MLDDGREIGIYIGVAVHHQRDLAFYEGKRQTQRAPGTEGFRFSRAEHLERLLLGCHEVFYHVAAVSSAKYHAPDACRRQLLEKVSKERPACDRRERFRKISERAAQAGAESPCDDDACWIVGQEHGDLRRSASDAVPDLQAAIHEREGPELAA